MDPLAGLCQSGLQVAIGQDSFLSQASFIQEKIKGRLIDSWKAIPGSAGVEIFKRASHQAAKMPLGEPLLEGVNRHNPVQVDTVLDIFAIYPARHHLEFGRDDLQAFRMFTHLPEHTEKIARVETLFKIGLVEPDQVQVSTVIAKGRRKHVSPRPQPAAAASLQLPGQNHLLSCQGRLYGLRVPAILVPPGIMAEQVAGEKNPQAIQRVSSRPADTRQGEERLLRRRIQFIIPLCHEYGPNR
jgi:hypothetical protein